MWGGRQCDYWCVANRPVEVLHNLTHWHLLVLELRLSHQSHPLPPPYHPFPFRFLHKTRGVFTHRSVQLALPSLISVPALSHSITFLCVGM